MPECILSKLITIRPNHGTIMKSAALQSIETDKDRRTALRHPTLLNWHKYKQLNNKVNNLIKFAKHRFYANIEHKIEYYIINNTKNYWKVIKGLIQNCQTSDSTPILKR